MISKNTAHPKNRVDPEIQNSWYPGNRHIQKIGHAFEVICMYIYICAHAMSYECAQSMSYLYTCTQILLYEYTYIFILPWCIYIYIYIYCSTYIYIYILHSYIYICTSSQDWGTNALQPRISMGRICAIFFQPMWRILCHLRSCGQQ